jgi:hypothetical protein
VGSIPHNPGFIHPAGLRGCLMPFGIPSLLNFAGNPPGHKECRHHALAVAYIRLWHTGHAYHGQQCPLLGVKRHDVEALECPLLTQSGH